MVSVILPAAGRGKRMKAGVNKVFLRLMGKPILFHTLRAFAAVPEVQEIVVVTGAEEVEPLRRALQGLGLFREAAKSVKVVAGGSERQYSVWNGLKASSEASDVVLVHDAARPLVSRATIEAVIEAARAHGAAIAAVPEKNTVKVVKDGVVTATPDRSTLWAVQTPQGFSRSLLMAANEKAESDGFLGTDDASLVERYGARVHVVMDSYQNIKVTTPEDLVVAEAFLRQSGGARRFYFSGQIGYAVIFHVVKVIAAQAEQLRGGGVAFRVHTGVVQYVFAFGHTQKSRALFKCALA